MGGLVKFSNRSESTCRFVEKIRNDALHLPIDGTDEPPRVLDPFVLVTATYGGGGDKGRCRNRSSAFSTIPITGA